jgi:hypothetical protein
MPGTATKTNPALWDKVKAEVTRGAKGGEPGQWSARKAQLATQAYKKAGGGYAGHKSSDNSLEKWQREEWGTRSGQASASTGERYLPKKARESLSRDEYDRSTRKKRADTAKGEQFSAQPEDVARKAANARQCPPPGRRHAGCADAGSPQAQHSRPVPDDQGGVAGGAGALSTGRGFPPAGSNAVAIGPIDPSLRQAGA